MNIWTNISNWFASAFSGFKFEPAEFLNHMHYMGQGMLSIFLVIGVIIIVTYLVNKITTKDK